MIEVKDLVKKYGSNIAVNHANFTINDGEIIGFLGPNGAGKSTTMNIITGFLSATSGTVSIDGYDILNDPIKAKSRIGFLPEIPPLYVDMTVREYLDFVYDLKKTTLPRKPHLDEIVKLVKIDAVQNRLIRNLSKGYRQRVGIAQALIGNPDVLILDEPTVGLDPQQIIEIRALISKLGKNHTVILSSHILSEIQAVCERIIIINQGYIIADGSTEELSKSISSDNSLIASIVGPPRQVLPAISAVEGVRSARVQGVASGSATEYFIEQRPDTDTRAALFDCVVQNGWKMVGLTSGSMSLEQVFLKLVEMSPEQAAAMFGRQLPEKAGEDSEEKPADNAADSGDPSDEDSKKGE